MFSTPRILFCTRSFYLDDSNGAAVAHRALAAALARWGFAVEALCGVTVDAGERPDPADRLAALGVPFVASGGDAQCRVRRPRWRSRNSNSRCPPSGEANVGRGVRPGAGQQQVRRLWANVGSFHVCLWAYTMTEAGAWGRQAGDLVDRSASPWDDASRRPSHADKRRAWRRELLGEEIRAALRPGTTEAEIRAAADRLLNLAA